MPNKWIEISSSSQPAAQFAEQVLAVRVQYVEQMLPLAAWKYTEDLEHVHQLRVACRRSSAALLAFRPLMIEKPKSMRRWLRRIRRAAGPARDTDVLLKRAKQESRASPFTGYVIARLEQQRIDVQQQLMDVEKRARPNKIDRSLKRCLARLGNVKPKQHRTIGRFAQSALQRVSQSVLALSGIGQPSLEQLHELRIAGKRLRYSIELFHSVFPSEIRTEFYPLVEKLQSRLGKLNDHATAQAMFQHWLANMPADGHAAEIASCVASEHELAEQVREKFLAWWTADRIAQLEFYLESLK